MINDFLDRHRYTLMALLSGAVLIGSGFSLGVGLFGSQPADVAESANTAKVSGIQAESELPEQTMNEKININTAPASELELLPGIGPSKAKVIVDYRNKNGPFKSIEEIQNVSGIGPKTFERIRELITVK